MPEQDPQQRVRNDFLGEIKAEIVGMQHHKAKIHPGEQVNLERTSKPVHDRRAIRVENGHCEPVGYLPRKIASWLAPLIDNEQIHLDGYVPQDCQEKSGRCPVVLMVFLCEKGHRLLGKSQPRNVLESLHQTILQAYENAQKYRNPELVLGLAKRLQPMEKRSCCLRPVYSWPCCREWPVRYGYRKACRQRSGSVNYLPPSPSASQPTTTT